MLYDLTGGRGLAASLLANPESKIDTFDAISFDMVRYDELLASGDATLADQYVLENSYLEYVMLQRTHAYAFRAPFDEEVSDQVHAMLNNEIGRVDADTFRNNEKLLDIGEVPDSMLEQLASTYTSSRLYPSWAPTTLQLMQRRAMQNSWLEMYKDFMGKPSDTHLEQHSVPPKTAINTAISLAAAAFTSNVLMEAGMRVMEPGPRGYLRGHSGWTHEFEVMLFLLLGGESLKIASRDRGESDLMIATGWLKPASFLDDIMNRKLDGYVFGFIPEPREDGRYIGAFGIDAKQSAGHSRPHVVKHASGIPTIRINQKVFTSPQPHTGAGSFAERMLRTIEQARGLNCDQQQRFEPTANRLARGLALMGVRL